MPSSKWNTDLWRKRACGQLPPQIRHPTRNGYSLVQLIAERLVIARGARVIINDLSFQVLVGEALVLTGPNGAGKTTLLRAIAGFLSPASGRLRLEGGDVEKSIAEQAHVVGHANAVKAALSVRENVTFWGHYLGTGVGTPSQVESALEHFGLGDLADFPAGYLSAGQKRRVGLARLLAAERPLWLLDEPTVSLDAASVAMLAKAVNHHTRAGGIAIAATHLPLGLERARELKLGAAQVAA
jgi:heme exporter protein A